jgi:hypothetical protein
MASEIRRRYKMQSVMSHEYKQEYYSRSSLGEDNGQFLLVDNGASDDRHNGHLNGILACHFVVARRVCKGCVISKSEAVVPSAKKRVARPEFKDAESGALLALGHGGRSPQLGGRDVADEIIVVRVVNPGGKQERKRGQNVRAAALVVCLRLMRQT